MKQHNFEGTKHFFSQLYIHSVSYSGAKSGKNYTKPSIFTPKGISSDTIQPYINLLIIPGEVPAKTGHE